MRPVHAALLLATLVWAASLWRFVAPPADERWSGALQHAQEVLGPDPRPLGSPAHERARRALVSALEALGADVEEHRATACGRWGRCGRVVDVLARLGPAEGAAVAVMAHYDSVPASPGAADDGVGVAIALEIARRYAARPGDRPLLIVLTDGEELGLLGSQALVRDERLPELAAVVNLEARGTAGPSLAFETVGPSGPLLARFARTATRPFTSSVFDAIYQVLPNDTDLSSLRDVGAPGINLSFLGRPLDYHGPGDRADRLSLASAAHQGDNAAALVASLLDEPLVRGGDVVWFDVLGLGVVRLPVWGVPLLGLVAVAGAARRVRQRRVPLRAVAAGAGLAASIPLAAAATGAVVGLGMHTGTAAAWRAGEGVVVLALAAPGAAVGLAMPRLGRGDGIPLGAQLFGALVGLLLAVVLPGAAHLWLLAAGFAAVPVPRRAEGAWDLTVSLLPLVVWAPLCLVLYPALGAPGAGAVTAAAAIGVSWFGFAAREDPTPRRAAAAAALVGLLAAGLAAATPRHTADAPAPVNLTFEQGPEGRTTLRTDGALGVATVAEGTGGLPAPTVDRRLGPDGLTVRVHSRRGAPTVGLQWEDGGVDVMVDGVAARPVQRDGRWGVWVHGVGAEGVTFVLSPPERVRGLVVADETGGVPDDGARPAVARPFQWGDRTRVWDLVGDGG